MCSSTLCIVNILFSARHHFAEPHPVSTDFVVPIFETQFTKYRLYIHNGSTVFRQSTEYLPFWTFKNNSAILQIHKL